MKKIIIALILFINFNSNAETSVNIINDNIAFYNENELEPFLKMQKEIIKNIKIIKESKKQNINFKAVERIVTTTDSIMKRVTSLLNSDKKEKETLILKEKKNLAVNLMRSRVILKSIS